MKKRIKNKWVKALRSGEYNQCAGKLVTERCLGDSFCCLGVLTNLYVEEKGNAKEAWYPIGTLSEVVMKWADMKSKGGQFRGSTLIHLNDTERYSFKEIATVIEDNWEEL